MHFVYSVNYLFLRPRIMYMNEGMDVFFVKDLFNGARNFLCVNKGDRVYEEMYYSCVVAQFLQ